MAEITLSTRVAPTRGLPARTAKLALSPKHADRVMAALALACAAGTAVAQLLGWLS